MGSKCKTSHEIWTKLEESFGGSISLEVESELKELSLQGFGSIATTTFVAISDELLQ
jgi:hypothetical protein